MEQRVFLFITLAVGLCAANGGLFDFVYITVPQEEEEEMTTTTFKKRPEETTLAFDTTTIRANQEDRDQDQDQEDKNSTAKCAFGHQNVTIGNGIYPNLTKIGHHAFVMDNSGSQVNLSTCLQYAYDKFMHLTNMTRKPIDEKVQFIKQYVLLNNIKYLTLYRQSLSLDQLQTIVQCKSISSITKMDKPEYYYSNIVLANCSTFSNVYKNWIEVGINLDQIQLNLFSIVGKNIDSINSLVEEFEQINCKFRRGQLEITDFILYIHYMGQYAVTTVKQYYYASIYNDLLERCSLQLTKLSLPLD